MSSIEELEDDLYAMYCELEELWVELSNAEMIYRATRDEDMLVHIAGINEAIDMLDVEIAYVESMLN